MTSMEARLVEKINLTMKKLLELLTKNNLTKCPETSKKNWQTKLSGFRNSRRAAATPGQKQVRTKEKIIQERLRRV